MGDLGQIDPSPPPCTLQPYNYIMDSGQKLYEMHNRQHPKTEAAGRIEFVRFAL